VYIFVGRYKNTFDYKSVDQSEKNIIVRKKTDLHVLWSKIVYLLLNQMQLE